VLGGNGQRTVAVARDQQRRELGTFARKAAKQFAQYVRDVLDPLPPRCQRDPGVVELLLRVPGAHPELEPAAGHLHRRGDVAGEQCRVVERHVEHERSHVHRSVAIAAAVSAGKGACPPRWSAR
jgi:hypothetical protein